MGGVVGPPMQGEQGAKPKASPRTKFKAGQCSQKISQCSNGVRAAPQQKTSRAASRKPFREISPEVAEPVFNHQLIDVIAHQPGRRPLRRIKFLKKCRFRLMTPDQGYPINDHLDLASVVKCIRPCSSIPLAASGSFC
jgi:hypothetical protein